MKIKKGANLDVTAVNNAVKGDNGVEFTDKTGTVTIKTTEGDGIKSDAIDTDIVETGAIEADKGYVTIAGGTFNITAAGDGIQADNYCTITGGDITINSGTEGIKANEVNLPVIADDAVVENQFVNGKITVSGETLIGAGTSDMAVTPTVSGQGYAKTSGSSVSAGTPVKITTSNGTFTFVPKTSWSWMFATMPEMTEDGTNTITANSGSTTGEQIFGKTVGNTFYGLIEND